MFNFKLVSFYFEPYSLHGSSIWLSKLLYNYYTPYHNDVVTEKWKQENRKKNLNRTKFGADIPSRELVLQKDESQYVFTVANWTFLKWLQKYFQDYQNAIFSRPWLPFLFAFFDD